MAFALLLAIMAATPDAPPDAFRSRWSELRTEEDRLIAVFLEGRMDPSFPTEEQRRILATEVTSFVRRLERLRPPAALERCHGYAVAAGRTIPPLVTSLPLGTPRVAGAARGVTVAVSRPTLDGIERYDAILRPLDAIAAGRRVCGIADLPSGPEKRGVDTAFDYSRPRWLADLDSADQRYLEAWSALVAAQTMTTGLLRTREPGQLEFSRLDRYWDFVADAVSALSTHRPGLAFETCHQHALASAHRLEQGLRTLAPTVKPAISGERAPFAHTLEVVAEQLRALDDARQVCGIYVGRGE